MKIISLNLFLRNFLKKTLISTKPDINLVYKRYIEKRTSIQIYPYFENYNIKYIKKIELRNNEFKIEFEYNKARELTTLGKKFEKCFERINKIIKNYDSLKSILSSDLDNINILKDKDSIIVKNVNIPILYNKENSIFLLCDDIPSIQFPLCEKKEILEYQNLLAKSYKTNKFLVNIGDKKFIDEIYNSVYKIVVGL